MSPLAYRLCVDPTTLAGSSPNQPRQTGTLNIYPIAIAWLFVALLAAIADTTVVGGVLTFVFFGLGPLALFMWLLGTPARHRRRQAGKAAPGEGNSLEKTPDDQ